MLLYYMCVCTQTTQTECHEYSGVQLGIGIVTITIGSFTLSTAGAYQSKKEGS